MDRELFETHVSAAAINAERARKLSPQEIEVNRLARANADAWLQGRPGSRASLYAFVPDEFEPKDLYLDENDADAQVEPLPVPSLICENKESAMMDQNCIDEPDENPPRLRNCRHENLNEEVLTGQILSMIDNASLFYCLPGTQLGNLRFGESLLGPNTGLGVFNMLKIGAHQPICEYEGIITRPHSENIWTSNEYSYLDPIRHKMVIGNRSSYG